MPEDMPALLVSLVRGTCATRVHVCAQVLCTVQCLVKVPLGFAHITADCVCACLSPLPSCSPLRVLVLIASCLAATSSFTSCTFNTAAPSFFEPLYLLSPTMYNLCVHSHSFSNIMTCVHDFLVGIMTAHGGCDFGCFLAVQ